MRCPFCGHEDTTVKDTRASEDHSSIRRRRFCSACGSRFTTQEHVQLRDLYVQKKGGRIEAFDRDKLKRAVALALHKRPISEDRIDRIVSSIVRQLEASGETDISASFIGDKVMQTLASLDAVAYIRYASIYHNFNETTDFQAFIDKWHTLRTQDQENSL